jgi:biopolymer transport protein ExbD
MIRLAERYDEPQINVAPLVDIVFFVIVFFLSATTFTQREREQEVLLPSNGNQGSLSREIERHLVINVLADGTARLQGRKASEGELVARIRERREVQRETPRVMVRADRRTAYGNVAAVLAAVERAGVPRPYVVTRLVEIGE